jgi:hypothetical protein
MVSVEGIATGYALAMTGVKVERYVLFEKG